MQPQMQRDALAAWEGELQTVQLAKLPSQTTVGRLIDHELCCAACEVFMPSSAQASLLYEPAI